jgi:hypothetical protein
MHPQKPIGPRKCLWCRQQFASVKNSGVTYQKFCHPDCRNAFYAVRQRIFNQHFFENAKMHEELERLEKLGKDYKLEG